MAWNKDNPAGNQKIRLSDEEIRANNAALETTLSQEHYFPNLGNDGQHKFPVEVADPAGAEGALAIVNDFLKWYSNGAWHDYICPYPVGAIYESVSDATPDVTWPDTTWDALGPGRVLVGIDATDTDFDTPEEEGGEKTHTLTVDEIPAHTHSIYSYPGNAQAGAGGGHTTTYGAANTGSIGGGGAHNNLQPYLVVYRWVRLT